MENNTFIEEFKNKFTGEVIAVKEHSPLRITFTIIPRALTGVAEFLFREKTFRYIISSALHSRAGHEIYYHFSNDHSGHILNIHVVLPHEDPRVDSLANIIIGAEWIEREMHELFGIGFTGHPNLVPLLSDGNWPEGTYPYRKDFMK